MKPASPAPARLSLLHAVLLRTEFGLSQFRFGCFTALLAAACFLSLSDSVGASYKKPIVSAKNLVTAFVPGFGLDPVTPGDLPVGIDAVGHFILWGSIGAIASVLVARQGDRVNVLSGLWALSALVEVAQKYFTLSRHAQLKDILANGLGLAAGSLMAMVLLAWARKVVTSHPRSTGATLLH